MSLLWAVRARSLAKPSSIVNVPAGSDFESIVQSGIGPWTVQAGAVFPGVTLNALNAGTTIRSSNLDIPFVLDGGGSITQAIIGSSSNITIEGMRVQDYGGFIVPSDFQGRRFVDRSPFAVDLGNYTNTTIRKSGVENCDGGWRIQKSGVFADCWGWFNHQSNIVSSNSDGVTITNFLHHDANYEWVFDDGYEAGSKFVNSTNITISGFEAYNNNGVGLWCDITNTAFQIFDSLLYDNSAKGFSYEINNGPLLVDGMTCFNNGGAAGLHLSNARGTPSEPLLIKNFDSRDHNVTGWTVAIQNNPARSPLAGYVTFEDGICENIILHEIGGATIPGVTVNNVLTPGGSPVVPQILT